MCYICSQIKLSEGVYSLDSLCRGVTIEVCHRWISQQCIDAQRTMGLSHGDDTCLVAIWFCVTPVLTTAMSFIHCKGGCEIGEVRRKGLAVGDSLPELEGWGFY